MEKYGFVYIWYDRKHKKFYIGCRWGNEYDNYICSSSWMKRAYRNRKQDFKRKILARIYTNKKDLLKKEYEWLKLIKKEELGKKYYNLHNHQFNHWYTSEVSRVDVIQKIKNKNNTVEIKKKLRESKLGDKNPMKRQDVVDKRLSTWKKGNHLPWNKGISTGPNIEHSERMKGKIPINKGKKLPISNRNKLPYNKNWIIIDKEGTQILVHNLNSWCEDKGLSATNLRSVAYGRRLTHKGYKCIGPIKENCLEAKD